MTKIAIYVRVSTVDKQDYQRQISDCLTAIGDKYTKDNIDIYGEKISGYVKQENRPQLELMLSKIEAGEIYDMIYITEVSRLGREPEATRKLIDYLTTKKIPIFITSINKSTLDENGERDTVMNIVIQVLIEFSNAEAVTFKKRSISGLLQSAKSGKVGGGAYLPYGYKKGDDKMMIIDTNEAKIIVDIFNYYKAGAGAKKIAGYLNDRKIKTKMNILAPDKIINFKIEKNSNSVKWSDKTVLDIISNPLYKGDRRYKGIIIPAPAIISSELFDECEQIRTTKTNRNYLTTYTYLLKDTVVCGCCGRNYFAKYKPTPTGDKVYICSSRLIKGGNCGNVGVNISLLESMVFNIISTASILKYIDDSKRPKESIVSTISTLETDLKINEKLIMSNENKKELLLNAYLNETIKPEAFTTKSNELESIVTNLIESNYKIKKAILDNKIMLEKYADKKHTMDMLMNAKDNRTELKQIYNQLIDKIILTNISPSKIMVSISFSLNGKIIIPPITYILDLNGIRKGTPEFKYFEYNSALPQPSYTNNKLGSFTVNDPPEDDLPLSNENIFQSIIDSLSDKNECIIPAINHLKIPLNK